MEKTASQCSRPINLAMIRADTDTGAISHRIYEKPCGNRLADKCAHCSIIYRRDAMSVLRSGLHDIANSAIPFTFITFTAPGASTFGPTHRRVISGTVGKSRVSPCGCKKVHDEGDALIGTAIDPNVYRYDKAADFNAHAGRLLAVTMQRLGRVLGRKLEYARVAEFQTRGLIHFHVIVRGIVTERSVQTVVRGGMDLRIIDKNKKIIKRRKEEQERKKEWKKRCKESGPEIPFESDYKTERRRNPKVNAVTHGEWMWGPQVDVQHVLPGGKTGVGAYLAKLLGYAVKGTDSSANGPLQHRRKMQGAAVRTCGCKKGWSCGGGARHLADTDIVYQSEQSAKTRRRRRRGYLTKLAEAKKFCRRHQLAINGWGFRGHVLSFSRDWGLTFKEVRDKRKEFATATQSVSKRFVVLGWTVTSRGSPLLA
jgi:hypothetical protein